MVRLHLIIEKSSASVPFSRSNNEHKLWWKVAYTKNGTGHLTATVNTEHNDHDELLTAFSTVNVNFLGENGLFSSVEFELNAADYRVSLLKKKILSGKTSL